MENKKSKALPITMVFVAMSIGVYLFGALSTKDEFPKNTYVNDINVGGMNLGQADDTLKKSIDWNGLKLVGNNNEIATINVADIDYQYVSNSELKNIFEGFDNWKWFTYLNKDNKYSIDLKTSYSEDKLHSIIDNVKGLNEDSQNAKIVYSEKDGQFSIEEEVYGMQLSKEQLYDLAKNAIDSRQSQLSVDEFIKKPEITSDNIELVQSKDEANKHLNVTITYDFGGNKEIVDKSIMKDWFKQDGTKFDFDLELVRAYEDTLGNKYDTYGKARDFKASTGEQIKISGGTYGWLIHRTNSAKALIEAIKSGENKTIEPVYSYKASIKGKDDIGNSYVEISLKNQKVWMYVNGELKVESLIVTGNVAEGNATPPGIFPLNYKQKGAILRGPGYAAPVDYWMPFNGGIGLHDATWRNSFGGSIYKNNGSHGCINLPLNAAKEIYTFIYPGMPVIVY